MCLSRSSWRVENSCQQCSACSSRVFTAVGSRPSRPYLRRSASEKAVPLVVNASKRAACPRFSSAIVGIPSGAVDLRVDTKPDLTPVSDADHAVETGLRATLARARPDDAVLGEEFGGAI